MKITPVTKGGRVWNGFQKDRGTVVHAIEQEEPHGYWGGKALCGTEPGSRGYGWVKATVFISRDNIIPAPITCEKCLKKLTTNTL